MLLLSQIENKFFQCFGMTSLPVALKLFLDNLIEGRKRRYFFASYYQRRRLLIVVLTKLVLIVFMVHSSLRAPTVVNGK